MTSKKRLIDVNALIAEYDRVHIGPPGGARKLMEDAPTVEAVEVVRGKWEDDHGDYVCSCCHTVFTDELVWISHGEGNEPNYCPNCGAKMDGGNDKHEN